MAREAFVFDRRRAGRIEGTVLTRRIDRGLVRELVMARRVRDPLDDISPREREVLALTAERRSNADIARQLWVTEGTVEKHVRSILTKLDVSETADDHRLVPAVLTFLNNR